MRASCATSVVGREASRIAKCMIPILFVMGPIQYAKVWFAAGASFNEWVPVRFTALSTLMLPVELKNRPEVPPWGVPALPWSKPLIHAIVGCVGGHGMPPPPDAASTSSEFPPPDRFAETEDCM